MSDEWVKEAEHRIREDFDSSRIKKVSEKDPAVAKTFVANSRESMEVADHLLKENRSSLWAIVCSYYSMYYIASAVLYTYGYKIEGLSRHQTTSDALIVFTRNKLKKSLLEQYEESMEQALILAGSASDELLKSFDKARQDRGKVQYRTTEEIKKSRAEESIKAAKAFVTAIEKLLQEKG